jgi:class 3 adenylate cyclase
MTFESLVRQAAESGYIREALGREEGWVQERLARRREGREPHVQHRGDGRWILVSEHKTRDGGTVAVYSDITEMKQREQELAEKSRTLEQLSSQLAKYLSPQIYESIFTGRQEVKVASRRKKLTVFFSDIAGFTEAADRLESEELTQLLNRYLTEMSKIALDHGATVDKYVGDAVMAFFGDPETKGVKEDAVSCVRMAIAMQRRMRELQSEWLDMGLERPFQLRIGINTGFCTVGNFGSEDRMDYTIIGNEVNLAARLQSQAELGGILLAHETYALVKDTVMAEAGDTLTVKGFAESVRTHKVAGLYDDLIAQGRVIRQEQDGVSVRVELKGGDKAAAILAVEDLLSRLKGGAGLK